MNHLTPKIIQNFQNSPELVHVQSSCVSCPAPPDIIVNNIDELWIAECHDDHDNDDDHFDDDDNGGGNQDSDD